MSARLEYGILEPLIDSVMDNKLYQELLNAVAVIEYSEEDSGPVVKKLKTTTQVCERPNCGKIISENLVHHLHYQKPYPHWRSNCKQCLCYLNPYTKEPLQGSKSNTQNTVNTLVRHHYKQLRKQQGQEVVEQALEDMEQEYPGMEQAKIVHGEHSTAVITDSEEATITCYIYHRNK